jgi:hypothetical protein
MEHRPAVLTGPPSGKTAYQLFVIHFNIDNVVNRSAHFGEDRLKGLGLGNRSWESIENETWMAIRCLQPFLDDPDDQLIRDEFPVIHKAFGFHS